MNPLRKMLLLGVLFGLAGAQAYASTNLLPGLLYRDPPVKLEGSLVFLYSTNGYWSANATIYEFDLEKKALRLVVESPGGYFDAAKDGQTFCVRYGVVTGFGHFITNALIYSQRLGVTRTLAFEKCPSQVTFLGDTIYFFFDRRAFAYDIRGDALDRWAFHHDIFAELLTRSVVTGEKTTEKTTYGDMTNLTVALPGGSGHRGFKAVSGKWLFFEGGDGALQGTRLVSSPQNEFDTRYNDPKGKNVRVLKRFPKPRIGSYNLAQMSPCGRFAFLRRSSPIGDGWGQTYYVVNAENGETHAVLEDKVCSIGESRISYVHWVKGASAAH